MNTTIISSTASLFYKMVLPLLITSFGTLLCIALWTDEGGGLFSEILPRHVGNGIFTLLLLLWVWFAFTKLWTLRRVEVDAEHLYVSDYWNTAKYDLTDIESVTTRKRGWVPTATIHLSGKGRFGREIRFIRGRDAQDALKQWLN